MVVALPLGSGLSSKLQPGAVPLTQAPACTTPRQHNAMHPHAMTLRKNPLHSHLSKVTFILKRNRLPLKEPHPFTVVGMGRYFYKEIAERFRDSGGSSELRL
jgi:hypothetical protein